MPEYVVCRLDQLVEGRGRPARAGTKPVAVFLVDGRVHVVDNECLHVGSPLDCGIVEDGTVRCPWHGWAYDLSTGEHLTAFGRRPGIRAYPCEVDEGSVKVTVTDAMGE